jgi:hypothetical protein
MSLAWLDKEPDIFCSDQRPAPGIGTMATLRFEFNSEFRCGCNELLEAAPLFFGPAHSVSISEKSQTLKKPQPHLRTGKLQRKSRATGRH